ncbi:hypothetical protein I203_100148 [Kwoniella mangroviensis CBS 8507]|uniref:uncharacterized protein n=1 Tax=Kwoniella mangroviensis CBS 8507 TaxID=1296122 RepID=UPI00080D6941|nr:uncharacterized protein I203_08053 [Kwoniella mangroviensis CBS 8507]OCF62830.1 hypothetical protein I203_08053 [Kwoniella mangroviensis CBS 8507]
MPRKSTPAAHPQPATTHPYPPSSAPIERLPLELKLRVVSYLSTADAHNLASVSKPLQNAAESVIWSKVDMSLPTNWDKQILLWEDSMPDWWAQHSLTPEMEDTLVEFKSTMDMEGGSIGWSRAEDSDICWNLRNLKFITRMKQVSTALTSHPSRGNWVRELRLELPQMRQDRLEDKRTQMDTLKKIVEIVRGNLRIVRLGSPEVNLRDDYSQTRYLDSPFFLDYIGLTERNVGKLHTLELVLEGSISFQAQMENIVNKIETSTIKKLVLNPSWSGSSWFPDSNDDPIPKTPSLKTLKTLHLNHLHPRSAEEACGLIGSADSLEELKVRFTDDGESAWDVFHDRAIKTFREHKTLRRIEWYGGLQARWWFEKLVQSGFDNVEVLVQNQAIECESETFIENTLIPPFSSLRTILIPCRTPKWYRHLSPPDWAKAPPPRNSISPHVISHLLEAPNLLAVQFSSLSSLTINEVLDSSQWCDKRVNGVLIRSYINEITGEELFHFRRLELLIVQPKIYDSTYEDRYDGMKECKGDEVDHRWVDHTSFRNATVPPPILKKVYKTSGEKLDWTTPGRGISLPETAWEVLRSWRVKLPDKGLEGRKIVTRRMARDLQ